MSKKRKKDKKTRRPKINTQLPISKIRKVTLDNPYETLQNARQYPLLGCWTIEEWQESGIAPVIIARQQDDGKVLFANYLVDLYCLGVKDVVVDENVPKRRFERLLQKMCMQAPEALEVELAHEIVYGAIDYARKYGFEPHPDFTRLHADQVLDPPDAHPRTHTVEFGQDGKPTYISGPNENQYQSRRILQTLERTAGEGNFHYIIGFDDADVFGD